MNSKAEFNRCEIARLVLGDMTGGVDEGEEVEAQEQAVKEWVRARAMPKVKNPITEEVKDKPKKMRKAKGTKHKKEDDLAIGQEDDQPKKRRKKYQHEVLDSGWVVVR